MIVSSERTLMVEKPADTKIEEEESLEIRTTPKDLEANEKKTDLTMLQNCIREIRPVKKLVPIKIFSFFFYGGKYYYI